MNWARGLIAVTTSGLVGLATLLPATVNAATVEIGPNRQFVVDGEPFLPIMQWAQSSSRIAYQSQLGINTFVGNGGQNSSAEYLAECAAHGVWGVMSPSDMSVKDHPALLGWIFGDEPDLESHAVEPAQVLAEYQSIKSSDPNHVTLLTLTSRFYSEFDAPDWMNGNRDRYYEYCQASDVVGFDHYPIYGWCRPDWIHQVGEAATELATTYCTGVPMYAWIELVRTSSKWCELDERGEDDGPYAEETRNEVWQAIVAGATAIGYFTHSWECPGYTQFCLTGEQEAELSRTNGQLAALSGPILSSPYQGAVTVQATGSAQIRWLAKEYQNRVYLFAVNVDRLNTEATISFAGIDPTAQVEVFDENRTITTASNTFTDNFDALGVHIYVIDLHPTSGSGAGGNGQGGPPGSGGAGATTPGSTGTGNDQGNTPSGLGGMRASNLDGEQSPGCSIHLVPLPAAPQLITWWLLVLGIGLRRLRNWV